MNDKNLKGWNYIVLTLIRSNFKTDTFSLKELYAFEPYFRLVYPSNLHIKDKLRQILQNLRNRGLITFQSKGMYTLNTIKEQPLVVEEGRQELVYLLSNESIPGWVKIGRTNGIDRRLKELYNTSVPLPFKLEDKIETHSLEESRTLERNIHSIIDTLNPNLRKLTGANKREFFKMTPEEGKSIFTLVTRIIGITPTQINQISA